MHLPRLGRRADRTRHADHQPGQNQPRNHDEDDHLDEAEAVTATTSDDGDLPAAACMRAHWTLTFPVTGLLTTLLGPPVAVHSMVASLLGAASLCGGPFVS